MSLLYVHFQPYQPTNVIIQQRCRQLCIYCAKSSDKVICLLTGFRSLQLIIYWFRYQYFFTRIHTFRCCYFDLSGLNFVFCYYLNRYNMSANDELQLKIKRKLTLMFYQLLRFIVAITFQFQVLPFNFVTKNILLKMFIFLPPRLVLAALKWLQTFIFFNRDTKKVGKGLFKENVCFIEIENSNRVHLILKKECKSVRNLNLMQAKKDESGDAMKIVTQSLNAIRLVVSNARHSTYEFQCEKQDKKITKAVS